MIVTTTTAINGRPVTEYVRYSHRRGSSRYQRLQGPLRELEGYLRDIVGGRSAGYESSLRQAREMAVEVMVAEAEQAGADAVIEVDLDYESIEVGQGGRAC
jgi:uncharacterized protein YbjQ (UPF0145 family)